MLANRSKTAGLIANLVETLSPDFLRALIGVLGENDTLEQITKIRIMRAVNNDAACYRLWEFLSNVRSTTVNISANAVALGLECALAASENNARKQHIDVVWTGPNTNEPLRRSAAVLLELIRSAEHEIVVMSFAAFRIPDALSALEDRAQRGVRMSFILESKEDSDGRLHTDAAAAFNALAAYANVKFYTWPLHNRPPGALLHAKAIIVDGHTALTTSANLTESAISSNIELGLLIRNGDVPSRIHEHIKALIGNGEFSPLER